VTAPDAAILPYSQIVGQRDLRLALETSYVAPQVGGVLATGERGTAKSTTVRAFALMAFGRLPVTLPINATDDRVLGGWQIDALMRAEAKPLPGLLEQAGAEGEGLLYVDEVNLLDDHLVNLILDVASTGLLNVQRDGFDEQKEVRFRLVGTMNPDEGGLRPQLLDRFGLVVTVAGEGEFEVRRRIVRTVLRYEEERTRPDSPWIRKGREADEALRRRLAGARDRLPGVAVPDGVVDLCTRLASAFELVGHRGELVMAWAARALAAIEGEPAVRAAHVGRVARLALVHRRPSYADELDAPWTAEDDQRVDELVRAAGDEIGAAG
jgi:magnesium chelatase subunit I